jgi:hypothetical protein
VGVSLKTEYVMKTKALFIILFALFVNRDVLAQDNKCVRKVGPFHVELMAYANDAKYCQSIPSTGQVTFTLDYAPQALRDMKTEVRLIQVESWPVALEGKNDKAAQTVLHLPPQTYPNGLVILEHTFTEPGYYVELVTLEGDGQKKYEMRFPFRIGHGWAAEWKESGKQAAYIALFALALGTAYYLLMVRKKRGKTGAS